MTKGRNILTPNSRLEDRDDRGYYQVERWIMSVIQTQNPVKINGEGFRCKQSISNELKIVTLLLRYDANQKCQLYAETNRRQLSRARLRHVFERYVIN